MKKLSLSLVILIAASTSCVSFAQDADVASNESSVVGIVRKGNFIIDPYYGAPNFGRTLVSNITFNNTNIQSTGAGGIGPLGIRAEYLLADKFGLGIVLFIILPNLD